MELEIGGKENETGNFYGIVYLRKFYIKKQIESVLLSIIIYRGEKIFRRFENETRDFFGTF
jgi:hypothetical protein